MVDYYNAVKIGALLHDIGKFVQRAHKNPKKYTHAEFGYKFLKDLFDNNLFLNDVSQEEKELILKIVKEHHNQKIEDRIVNIVRLADWLSSGERFAPKNEESKNEYILESKEQKLLSIFETVCILNESGDIENKINEIYNNGFKYSLKPLNVSNAIFADNTHNPTENYEEDDKNNNPYKDLFMDFCREIEDFKSDYFFEELLQLMQKYTWCIPSVTMWKSYGKIKGGLPDVSLYDHSRTTCAIACCLYKLYEKGKINDETLTKLLNNNKEEWKKPLFSLIHGDLSGIQDFVFTITTKYATKMLKGRSFYLDFLTEYFAKYICKKLDLPIANIIFYGGGHFYILSYNVDENLIEDLEKEINTKLFNMFKTKIYLTIAKVDVSPNDFKFQKDNNSKKVHGFAKKWKEVSEITLEKKLKKFRFKLNEVFEPYNKGIDRCKICGMSFDVKNENMKKHNEKKFYEINGDKICRYCASFIGLTNLLKNYQLNGRVNFKEKVEIPGINEIWNFYDLPIIKELDNCSNSLNDLDSCFNILNDREYFLDEYHLPRDSGDLIIPYKIWSISFPIEKDEIDKNIIKDFDKLAEEAEKRTGTKKIGILKMDVDNLGEIFTKGLGNLASLSRMATLSSMLTLFFTGYIPYLIRTGTFEINGEKCNFKDNIYLVYAGGDDTLIVGAWDAIWELSKRIREDFKKFVCYNPYITLSAGVVFVNPKFEFKKAVNMAEEELESSKGNIIYENEKLGKKVDKNSLTVFNCSMNWDLEIKYDEECWKRLEPYLKEIDEKFVELKDLSKEFNESLLEKAFERAIEKTDRKRILHVAQITGKRLENVIKKENEELIMDLPYYWRIIYYIRRNYKDDELNYVNFLENYVKNKVKKMFSSAIKLSFNDLKVSAKIVEMKKRGVK